MKRWVVGGAFACFSAACEGQIVHLGEVDGGSTRGDGGETFGGSASGGGPTSSGASATGGGGGSFGGSGSASSGASGSSGGTSSNASGSASSTSGASGSSGGTSSNASGSSGGGSSGSAQVEPDGGVYDEVTVVEEDGATVTGVGYGNPFKFPSCTFNNGLVQAGYLFTVAVDLPPTGTVQGLGLVTVESADGTDSVVTMALYALAPAGEMALVTQTASTPIAVGSHVIPTPPTALPSTGTRYFIAVEFQQTATICADGWGGQIQFGPEPYGTFPSIWSATSGTTDSELNLFVVVN